MDCQKLIVYGILVLVGIYILKNVCGVKLPFIEGFDNPASVEAGAGAGASGVAGPTDSELIGEQPTPPVVGAATVPPTDNAPPAEAGSPSDMNNGQWGAAEPGSNEFNMPIEGIQTAPSNCYPQNTLTPNDLLPEGEGGEIQNFNEGLPEEGEGILKGVNFLDAGFHVGVNTVGQSLRNANLNLRAEPPNPRSQVSPWMNSTIDIELARKPLADGVCNRVSGQVAN